MTDARTCAECGAPLPADRAQQLCAQHADNVLDVLTQIPDLVDDVNLTITRQTATGARNGARSSSDTVIAFDARASKTLATALARLVTWAKTTTPQLLKEQVSLRRWLDSPAYYLIDYTTTAVAERRHDWLRDQLTYLTGGRWLIASTHRRLISILTDQLDTLLARPDAIGFARDIARTHRELLAASDTPAPRLYLGPCRADPLKKGVLCTSEVYAVDHSDNGKDHLCDRCRTVKCPVCSTEHDVAQRRAWLTEAMEDRLATAGDIARGLAGTTGITATKDQINNWVRKSRLLRHGVDQNGVALYRVGDVIDLAHEAAAARHAERPVSA
ncbi:MAG: hypothetical protein AB7I38_14355 [Dehalococcoidia bacterium]